jgi:hypothetical protein
MLEESGALWLDNFKLAFRNDNNQWQSISIINPSFEEGESRLTGWMVEPEEYPVSIVSDAVDGTRSAKIENRSKVRLSPGLFMPIGWSADATMAYALERDSRKIVGIPITGGSAKTVFDLPWSKDVYVKSVAMTPDARRFVFSVGQSQEDIWIIDNFDQDVQ